MGDKLIVATHNLHKLQEIQEILGSNLEFVSLIDLGFHNEIIENGVTFNENAQIKSDTIFNFSRGNILADDSGLEVDALDGRPGVYSARYAGLDCNDQKNMDKLLSEMMGVDNRGAQFRTVLSLKWFGNQYFFEGIVRGTISLSKKGNDGFGYDPIFIPEGFDKTFAELGSIEKNKLSHRFNALMKFKEFLSSTVL